MGATRFTLRDASPVLIERGVAFVSRLAVYANQVPTAYTGTYTLTDAGGNVVVTGAVSSDGTETTYGGSAGDTTDAMAYSTRWRESWALLTAASPATTTTFTRDVWLVRSALQPTVTVDDLCRRHRDLRDLVDGGDAAIEGYIVEAWATIQGDLIKRGKRPSLIMESWALRTLHIYRALALLFVDASTRFAGTDRYADLAKDYEEKAGEEWNKGIRFEYDANEDGIADVKSAGSNVLVITAGNMSGPRYRAYGGR